jgi:hypothetical protein
LQAQSAVALARQRPASGRPYEPTQSYAECRPAGPELRVPSARPVPTIARNFDGVVHLSCKSQRPIREVIRVVTLPRFGDLFGSSSLFFS